MKDAKEATSPRFLVCKRKGVGETVMKVIFKEG